MSKRLLTLTVQLRFHFENKPLCGWQILPWLMPLGLPSSLWTGGGHSWNLVDVCRRVCNVRVEPPLLPTVSSLDKVA